ncbi:ribose 5-phosphate isomerase B [Natribacillus halophilus]|uniref:Ribose 5-phosphate isomerase B n=1 Tax=Natribacillus halophilus TaxID=549003 RepID=A0A1G8KED9_9BACI|nr:ribose 5-phosphate isomerase B [Natribacillus halophilus]SDI41761.1 ribose 5-phosphate isomerase B [Natribacillus halophilus]
MKVVVGADHAGFPLKGTIVEHLESMGHEVLDYGTFSEEPVDFPVITKKVCDEVKKDEDARGLMICGTGVGASIAANKIKGIRAALCHDIYSAHQCVEHDNVNVMAIGAQIVGDKLAQELIDSYLQARFSTASEFRRRVQMLSELENEQK